VVKTNGKDVEYYTLGFLGILYALEPGLMNHHFKKSRYINPM